MDDIAEKTRCNAEKANEAQALVAEAIADVKDGNEAMRNMILAMNEINASSESISKIIKVIDDIAFQTNILALNAAVEAARAGEAGKGFAVVAEEVRNLAAKSSQAASETAELIENSIRKVETGSGIADGTAKALEKITGNVEKSQVLINDIAEASNYQADAIEQIGLAVEQVSQVVQNNSATSEECAASSVDLANQANRMQELLAVYNLGTPRAAYQNAGGRNSEYNEQIISLKDGYNRY
jgi:methyl-accepting chemotaxis protein